MPGGCIDGDKDHVCAPRHGVQVGGEGQPPPPHSIPDQFLRARLVDGYLAPPQFRHFDRVGVHDGCPVTEVGHAGAGHQAHVAGPDHADVELIQDTLPTRDRPTRRPYDGSPLPAQTKPDGGPALGPLPAAEQLDGAGLVAVPLPVHVLDLHLLTLLYVPQLGLLAVQGHLAVLGDP